MLVYQRVNGILCFWGRIWRKLDVVVSSMVIFEGFASTKRVHLFGGLVMLVSYNDPWDV